MSKSGGHARHVRRDGIDPVLRSRARRRALQAVYAWQISGGFAKQVISQFAHEQAHEVADLAYFENLVEGVLSNRAELDTALTRIWIAAWKRSTRSSAQCCAWLPTSCCIARTCRTAW